MGMLFVEFAVVGLGRFGTSIAKALSDADQAVLAVDINEENVQKISNIVTQAVVADVTDIDAMRAIGIRNVDVAIITAASHLQASILGTLILKEVGVNKVIAKANNDLHGKVLERVGADRVVYPERDTGVRLARSLISTNIIEQIDLNPDYSIVEMIAPDAITNQALKDSQLKNKYGLYVMAIKSGHDVKLNPTAEDLISDGDMLIMIGENGDIDKFKKI